MFSIITACSPNNKTTEISTAQCSTQPKIVLEPKNVTPVSLSTRAITESGMVSSNKSLGYTFEAKSGQRLSYRTNQDICIWIYTPDNHILNSSDLPTNGKYTIQVSAPKGSTTFDLAINLESEKAVSRSSSTATPTPAVLNNVPITSAAISRPLTSITQTPSVTNNVPVNSTAIFNSSSTTTASPSIPNNISKPSPEKVIEDYYTKVNNHQYQKAWDILPPALQDSKTLHPNGYYSFIEWWYKVKYVSINKYYVANANSSSSIVNVWTSYHMNNGRTVPISLKFYMVWNDSVNKWDITKIQTF